MESKVYIPLAAGLILLLCSCGARTSGEKTPQAAPVTVKVQRVEEVQGASSKVYVGTVRPSKSTVLSSKYSGTLVSLAVRQGQTVRAGDVIARVSSQSVISMKETADATLRQVQDGYDRLKAVHESGSVADVKWVEISTQLEKAKASAAAANKAYEDCTIRAPYSGVIAEVYMDEGVETGVAEPIVRILDISRIEIEFPVPEAEISAISRGDAVQFTVPALGEGFFSGKVTDKGVWASALSHSYTCVMTPEGRVSGLLPGMVCKVSRSSSSAAVVVPPSAVKTDVDGRYVWTVSGGLCRKVRIETGGFSGDGVIVESGLRSGDTLIVEGSHKVSTGTVVKTVE